MRRKKILLRTSQGRDKHDSYKEWCRVFFDIYEYSTYYYRENNLPAVCLSTHCDYYYKDRLFATWRTGEDYPHFYDKTLKDLPLIKGCI